MSSKNSNFFKNEIRFRIWGLLSMYSELSFTELCKRLIKSKSTVHPHLQKLIEHGIVEVVREVKVRGNIPAKIFSLKKRELTYSTFTGIKEMEIFGDIFSAISFETHIRNFIDMKLRFYERLERSEDGTDVLKQMKDNEEIFNSAFFLTESQYRKTKELFNELLEKLNIIINNDGTKENVKPFHFMVSATNLNRILETSSIK